FVGQAKIAVHRERRFTLVLVAKEHDRRPVKAEWTLERCEGRPRGNTKIFLTAAAAESCCSARSAAVIGIRTIAGRTNRRSVRVGPPKLAKGQFGLGIRPWEDSRERQRSCPAGK